MYQVTHRLRKSDLLEHCVNNASPPCHTRRIPKIARIRQRRRRLFFGYKVDWLSTSYNRYCTVHINFVPLVVVVAPDNRRTKSRNGARLDRDFVHNVIPRGFVYLSVYTVCGCISFNSRLAGNTRGHFGLRRRDTSRPDILHARRPCAPGRRHVNRLAFRLVRRRGMRLAMPANSPGSPARRTEFRRRRGTLAGIRDA